MARSTPTIAELLCNSFLLDLNELEVARSKLIVTEPRRLSKEETRLLVTQTACYLKLDVNQIDHEFLIILKKNFELASDDIRSAIREQNYSKRDQLIAYSHDVYQLVSAINMPRNIISKVAAVIPLSQILSIVNATTEVFEADPRSKGLARTACWIALEKIAEGEVVSGEVLREKYLNILALTEELLRSEPTLIGTVAYEVFRGRFDNPREAFSLIKRNDLSLRQGGESLPLEYIQDLSREITATVWESRGDSIKRSKNRAKCITLIQALIEKIYQPQFWTVDEKGKLSLKRDYKYTSISRKVSSYTGSRASPFFIERTVGELILLGFLPASPIHEYLWKNLGVEQGIQDLIRKKILQKPSSGEGNKFYREVAEQLYNCVMCVVDRSPYGLKQYYFRTRHTSHSFDCFEYIATADKFFEQMLVETSSNVLLIDRLVGGYGYFRMDLTHQKLGVEISLLNYYLKSNGINFSSAQEINHKASFPVSHTVRIERGSSRIELLHFDFLEERLDLRQVLEVVRTVLLGLTTPFGELIRFDKILVTHNKKSFREWDDKSWGSLSLWAGSRGISISEDTKQLRLGSPIRNGGLILRVRGSTGRVQLQLEIEVGNQPCPSLAFHTVLYKNQIALEITCLQLMRGSKDKVTRLAQLNYLAGFTGGPCFHVLIHILYEIARLNKIEYIVLRPRDYNMWWAKEHRGDLPREWPQASEWGFQFNPREDLYEMEVTDRIPYSKKRKVFIERVVETFELNTYEEPPT